MEVRQEEVDLSIFGAGGAGGEGCAADGFGFLFGSWQSVDDRVGIVGAFALGFSPSGSRDLADRLMRDNEYRNPRN